MSARHEHGEYFSLDLGGSNLRVMFVKLSREHGQVVSAPDAATRGTPAQPVHAGGPAPALAQVKARMGAREAVTAGQHGY